MTITVGVLALQGAFYEHLKLLRKAAASLSPNEPQKWNFIEVRTPTELERCDGLIIPGGESTTISLVAARSRLLEPLRDFVKFHRRPTWGTCAGLILLAESANRTKEGGQELIGGLDVRVNRNHFGRQTESFQTPLNLPFLAEGRLKSEVSDQATTFMGVFIRAPVVEKVLPFVNDIQVDEQKREGTIVAPSRHPKDPVARKAISHHVDVLATLPGRAAKLAGTGADIHSETDAGDIVAVKQGNVFGTSFHPELTDDPRIHAWWLQQVEQAVLKSRASQQ
ncbi:glutamine amidotransferase subunit pdxT [Histoplasma ohiense]|nr:glutamine amidotransferase subunit pdxT [Histoplasma ohiense (nom. inval.)]